MSSIKILKQKLEHYQITYFFANVEGRDNVVCFRNMAEYIINQQWHAKRNDTECEAEHIMAMAAKIIRDEIRGKEYDQN